MTVPTSLYASEFIFYISWEHCDKQCICAVYTAAKSIQIDMIETKTI